jgi:glycosyltransferase involved in cell wall biosynthesis
MRNAEQYIHASLTSILEETGVPLEVVVIDDKSTDDSAKVVRSLADDRLHLLDGPGEGIAEALNAGLEMAAGEVIMRCDADDFFTAGRIARQVAWLQENPSYGAVCGGFSTFDADGREIASLSTGDDLEDITGELAEGVTRTSLCTFAIRRAVTEKTGRFRPYFVTAEDIDYQLRLCAVTRVMYLPGIVYKYRLHEDSITHQQDAGKRRFFEETARRFQHQRVETGRDELELGRPPAPPCLVGAGPGKASEQIAGMLMGQAWAEHGKGRKWIAIRKGWQALCRQPTDYSHWKSLLALILK